MLFLAVRWPIHSVVKSYWYTIGILCYSNLLWVQDNVKGLWHICVGTIIYFYYTFAIMIENAKDISQFHEMILVTI